MDVEAAREERLALSLLVPAFAVLFCAAAFHSASLIGSPVALDGFLTGTLPAGHWVFEFAPFKYRVVFHGAVELLAEVVPGASALERFHRAFVLFSGLTFVAAGLSLYALLRALDFAPRLAALGALAWSTLPPVLGAYAMPTQTREDFLGYAILQLGLIALLRGRLAALLVFTAVGVLTRETLLLLPALAALTPGLPWSLRLLPSLVGVATYAGVRFALGIERYDAVESGLFFTLAHAQTAALAAVMVFGWGWLVLARAPRTLARSATVPPGERRRRFERWLVPALLLVGVTHVLLARLEEIRISMLFAPWIVYVLLRALEARELRPLRALVAAGVVAAAIAAFELSGLATALRERINESLSYFAFREWWLIAYLQLLIAAALLSGRAQRSEP